MLIEKELQLNRQYEIHKNWLRIKHGWKNIQNNKKWRIGILLICTVLFVAILCCKAYRMLGGVAIVVADMWCFAIYMIAPVVILWYIILIGTPQGAAVLSDNLQRAGIINEIDEPPFLLERSSDPKNEKITILELLSIGIPLDLWTDKQLAAESALNAYIVKVQEGKERNRVLLHTVSSEGAFPDVVRWDDRYLDRGDGILTLGVTVAGTAVKVDLSNTPHVLIGGSSGSGKSVLMGLMLSQVIQKHMVLYIADFKGGLDYNGAPWTDACDVITTMDSVIATLDDLVAEMDRRKELLYDAGCKNIAMYNRLTCVELPRIVFGCDEIAELTDKSGISDKEYRGKIDHIIGRLATIARQGRALGIHLILATQRPDANVLPGQIKNNMDFRACGRADNTLAMIILDNADAADKLPKDGHRFMLADGTIFLPYYWEGNDGRS